jgi:hypothetical protein
MREREREREREEGRSIAYRQGRKTGSETVGKSQHPFGSVGQDYQEQTFHLFLEKYSFRDEHEKFGILIIG